MMVRTLAPISMLLAAAGQAVAQPCQQHWEAWGGGVAITTIVDWLQPVSTPSGPALYASGEFTSAGGTPLSSVGLWNSSTWSALGLGITGPGGMTSIGPNVTSLALFDDGSGPRLFAGGWYRFAGGQLANGIASWNGSAWTTYNGGLTYSGLPQINLMTVFNDGSGSALYAGGSFTAIAGVPARGIARWNGTAWAPVGSVVTTQSSPWVVAMAVFNDGSGPALYAGGQFSTIGGVPAANVAKWTGTTWAPLGPGLNGFVTCLAEFNDGSGPALYAGGSFTASGTTPLNMVSRWTGSEWVDVAGGVSSGFLEQFQVFDDGTGPGLFVCGNFSTAGGQPAGNIARYRNGAWSNLSGGASGGVFAMTVWDNGSGPALYVGGAFETIGGVTANSLARWTSCSCYANCDASTLAPILNVNDFTCFLNRFAAGDSRANCDGSTAAPVLNVNDYTCFLNVYAAGCS